ncbi:MarR family transcriptional regulator [Photobacterium swingsii]|uniref:MarR family transcriptional regulator n=1 Tax=Photobacterium swingsii TaxID=680026 RepID=A0A0J8V977_9GAMM|nr:MarR family transcriptional regulator [Photobacterium swingsii]KMV29175.1 MarR family transcriptional regulator [Photobacterium swingsii]PSW19711.1 MarR family transcriptional regulator [Photobacterium swingsii]
MSDRKSLESLFHLAHSLKRQMHDHIEEMELDIAPMHVRVLKIINFKNRCTAIDIAHLLNRDKAQVTRLLNALIKQGYVVKEPNPDDKRSQCLRVTTDGLKITSQIANIDKKMFELLSKDISQEELEIFERIASKMARNLAK